MTVFSVFTSLVISIAGSVIAAYIVKVLENIIRKHKNNRPKSK